MNYRSLNESIRSVTNPKAFKASPLEDEFLTDLTRAQIAAIKPLMKSKNWNKLKAYLMSQHIVDKDFNNITKYKMDRDILSVLQRSFSTYHEQVENESFSSLVEEQKYIEEYIDMLESALEAIAEELECSVEELISESTMKEIDTERQLKGGYFTDAKSRKAHVNNFYARKAKEKASRTPSEIEKDAKTDAYRAAYTKRTGKRVGRID